MFTSIPLRILENSKTAKYQEIEMRIMNLEAVLKDLRSELSELKEDNIQAEKNKNEKIAKYQRAIDNMLKA